MDEGLWTMVTAAGNMEKGVLALLACCSVILWTIILLKIPEVLAAKRNGLLFMNAFNQAESFGNLTEMKLPETDCVQASIFRSALAALSGKRPPRGYFGNDPEKFRISPNSGTSELVLLSMQHTSTDYYAYLQRGIGFMATIGSTTPFIGLFGTVVGIMTTFFDLGGVKNPNMQVVAPGISGALVATAAGLAVAIPAVAACNWFNLQIDGLREKSDCFIEKVMAIIRANQELSESTPAAKPATAPIQTPVARPRTVPAARPAPAAAEDTSDVTVQKGRSTP